MTSLPRMEVVGAYEWIGELGKAGSNIIGTVFEKNQPSPAPAPSMWSSPIVPIAAIAAIGIIGYAIVSKKKART